MYVTVRSLFKYTKYTKYTKRSKFWSPNFAAPRVSFDSVEKIFHRGRRFGDATDVRPLELSASVASYNRSWSNCRSRMESIEIRLRFQRTKLHYWHQNSVVPLVPASNHAGLQSPHRCLPEPANSIQVSQSHVTGILKSHWSHWKTVQQKHLPQCRIWRFECTGCCKFLKATAGKGRTSIEKTKIKWTMMLEWKCKI